MRGATSDASVMVFSGGGPPCSRSGGVSGYRIRTWIAGVAAARGDRAGGGTRADDRSFLTGRGGSRGGVNAGAHLRGVAHDDHAVTARHGLDEAVHPSRSVCHCWRARVREPASFGLPRDAISFLTWTQTDCKRGVREANRRRSCGGQEKRRDFVADSTLSVAIVSVSRHR